MIKNSDCVEAVVTPKTLYNDYTMSLRYTYVYIYTATGLHIDYGAVCEGLMSNDSEFN